ncbi:hypothetical protein DAI22_05g063801 [Oryza sativa Japonica Group]|nr:hypothetical protein DAI22_05g063801 [Oryza sativa Japonica Group]
MGLILGLHRVAHIGQRASHPHSSPSSILRRTVRGLLVPLASRRGAAAAAMAHQIRVSLSPSSSFSAPTRRGSQGAHAH